MTKILIDSQTAAITTDRIALYQEALPVTFSAVGLSTGEEIQFQFLCNDVWEDLYVAGRKEYLSSIDKVKVVYSPLSLRIVKGVTLNPVSIEMLSVNIEG